MVLNSTNILTSVLFSCNLKWLAVPILFAYYRVPYFRLNHKRYFEVSSKYFGQIAFAKNPGSKKERNHHGFTDPQALINC